MEGGIIHCRLCYSCSQILTRQLQRGMLSSSMCDSKVMAFSLKSRLHPSCSLLRVECSKWVHISISQYIDCFFLMKKRVPKHHDGKTAWWCLSPRSISDTGEALYPLWDSVSSCVISWSLWSILCLLWILWNIQLHYSKQAAKFFTRG